jgi:flavodoxin/Pyruvate/2-oxoacid:ferredoxin oxidoreductase delta subunit
MASANIHYFSGTGNTARAADLIAGELRNAGFEVSLHFISKGSFETAPPADLHVFAFPIYATGMPQIMVDYLKQVARGGGARAAVVATMGDIIEPRKDPARKPLHIPGYEGHALLEAAGLAARRGYDVFLTDVFSYPLNWTQAVSAPKPEVAAILFKKGDSEAAAAGRRIAAGERSIRHFGRLNALWTMPFEQLFRVFGRRGMAKLYVADEKCNRCGLCVSQCPVSAVKLARGRPRWGYNCESCQRCINICPKQAIQTSWPRLIAETVVTLVPVPFLLLRLGPHPWVPVRPVLLEVFCLLGVYVAAVWLLDVLLFGLELLPGVRRPFQWSLTKNFRRYLEPHFRPHRIRH